MPQYADDTTAHLPPPALTDHDVLILQKIVDHAEDADGDNPSHPRKALIDAYEAVFGEIGYDTNQDRSILQFILQMGALEGTLSERFHHELQRNDILLEFAGSQEKDFQEIKEEQEAQQKKEAAQESMAIDRDNRVLKTQTLRIWRERIEQLLHNTAVAEKLYIRTLSKQGVNALRYALREKTVTRKIDQRVAREALKTWRVEYRGRLLGRQRDENNGRNGLWMLKAGTKTHLAKIAQRDAACASFTKTKDRKLIARALGNTQQVVTQQKQREEAADNFYVPKLQEDAVVAIKVRITDMQDQRKKGDLARYYLISRRTIKIWLAHAIKRREERWKREKMVKEGILNELYKIFRGKMKKKLIRKIFYHWVGRMRIIRDHQCTAMAVWDQKEAVKVHAILTKWLGTAELWLQKAQEASQHYQHHLVSKTLNSIFNSARQLRTMQNRADQFQSIHLSDVAQRAIRKFAMRAFQLKQSQDSADALFSRTDRAHRRNIVQHWCARTQDRVRQSFQRRESVVDTGYGTDTEREEHSASALIPTPRPAYLNTPATRRIKALASLSTTPAMSFATRLQAGMSTPAPQEMGEEYAGTASNS